MKFIRFVLLYSLFLSLAFAKEKVCKSVVIHSGEDEEIKLTETEKLLVCGDSKNPGYETIPPYQASYFLTGFLQSRAYLDPKFETKDEILHVYPGKINRIKKIQVISQDKKVKEKIKKEIKHVYLNKPITPSMLSDMESRAKDVLAENGYPCGDVKSMVGSLNNRVELTLLPDKYYVFGVVEKEKIKGLRDNALDRYYPYKTGDTYNKKLLKLNEKRLFRADVMQGTYYLDNCADKERKDLELSQYFILGPPRTIRFGVGASTELGPMVRFRWSNNRYKSMASLLSASLEASFRNQKINLSADSFFWKNKSRQSLYSQFEIVRDSQIDYEQSVIRLKPHMKWSHDRLKHYQVYTLGPTFETGTYHSKVNPNTNTYSNVAIEGDMQWMSHTYEFYNFHPQEGDIFGVGFDYRNPALGFSDELLKLSATYAELRRLGHWGRGDVIGGIRINAANTWVSDNVSLRSLPPSVKFYGGGSDDIRGFLLNTLPDNNGLGALTKVSLKLELRRTHLMIETVEAFSFVDFGKFGEKSWFLDERLWYSPGIGLRWLSPFGMVQGYVARGLATVPSEDQGNFYYAGIGGTF